MADWYNHQVALRFTEAGIINEGTATNITTGANFSKIISFTKDGKFGDKWLSYSAHSYTSDVNVTIKELDLSGDFTVCSWVNNYYGSYGNGCGGRPNLMWLYSDRLANGMTADVLAIGGDPDTTGRSRIEYRVNGVRTFYSIPVSFLLEDGNDHFICMSRKNNIVYTYIDGKLINSKEYNLVSKHSLVLSAQSNTTAANSDMSKHATYDLNFVAGVAMFPGVPTSYLNKPSAPEVLLDGKFGPTGFINEHGTVETALSAPTKYENINGKRVLGDEVITSGLFANRSYAYTDTNYVLGTEDFTFCGWFWAPTTSYDPNILEIVAMRLTAKTTIGKSSWRQILFYMYGYNETNARIIISGGEYNEFPETVVSLPNRLVDTNWHHLAITRKDGVVRFFIDGVNVATISDFKGLYFNTTQAEFGSCAYQGGSDNNVVAIDYVTLLGGTCLWDTDFEIPLRSPLGVKSVLIANNKIYKPMVLLKPADVRVGKLGMGTANLTNYGSSGSIITSAADTPLLYNKTFIYPGKSYFEVTLNSITSTSTGGGSIGAMLFYGSTSNAGEARRTDLFINATTVGLGSSINSYTTTNWVVHKSADCALGSVVGVAIEWVDKSKAVINVYINNVLALTYDAAQTGPANPHYATRIYANSVCASSNFTVKVSEEEFKYPVPDGYVSVLENVQRHINKGGGL